MDLDRPKGLKRRRCYLVRHGDVVCVDAEGRRLAPREMSLSREGMREAKSLAPCMARLPLDRVVSSDHACAVQTAGILAGERSVTLEAETAFRDERVEARTVAGFERLLADATWGSLLLVSHDAVNRVLLGWAVGCGRVVKAVNVTPGDLMKEAAYGTAMERGSMLAAIAKT
jgi:probable phosphoglycerate mutase